MNFAKKLQSGLKSSLGSKLRIFSTFLISGIFFVLLALSTSINYSAQMFSAGFEYWLPAIAFTVRGFYLSGGWAELILNIVYSLLVGIIATNTYIQFKTSGLELGNLSGIAPGVLVAGCAGCGVGVLSLIGLSGIIASMPFQGLGLKILGMLLIIYFIAKIGDPEVCTIPSS